jgi:hypothetical protein
MASCDELANAAQEAFSALLLVSRACEQTSDCVIAQPHGTCIPSCGTASSVTAAPALEAAAPKLCEAYDAAHCPPMFIPCPPPSRGAVCMNGTCVEPCLTCAP